MRNRFFIFLTMITFSLLFFQCSVLKKDKESPAQIGENKHQTNRIIIYYETGINLSNLKTEISKYGGKIIYEYKNFNALAVEIPQNKSVEQSIEHFKKQEGVLNVNADGVSEIHTQ